MVKLFTTKQAAAFIGCTPNRVRQLVRANKIKGIVDYGQRAQLIPEPSAKQIRDKPSGVGRPRIMKRKRIGK